MATIPRFELAVSNRLVPEGNDMGYQTSAAKKLRIRNVLRNGSFNSENIVAAVERCNKMMSEISKFEINIFEILGMRNLSGFVGEAFAAAVAKESSGLFVKNPHQDGYPDLLLMDSVGKAAFDDLATQSKEKGPFSPFLTGGVEVKATVGSVPDPKALAKKGLVKPEIGDQRISLLNTYDWKSHHRDTNNLLGIIWDFINGIPCVVAVFYSSDLSVDDWGNVVQPSAGGGRTTSVSIIKSSGINKMYQGWLCVIDDERYANFINKKNSGSLIPVPVSLPGTDS
jgi:hypothetical protein